MAVQEVRALPLKEKIQIMETIWEDLRDRFERMEISPEPTVFLAKRRTRAIEGTTKTINWDSVKGNLGS